MRSRAAPSQQAQSEIGAPSTQQIVIAGGGSTGWHSHPGPVLVTVKSGALRVIYASDHACSGTAYQAGQSFIDRGDAFTHIARNVSSTDNVEHTLGTAVGHAHVRPGR